MQVHASPPHGYPNQAPSNGIHQSPVPNHSEDMNPYQQQQYPGPYPPQQARQQQAQQYPQQHRQYQQPPSYLPPMQSHQGMPGHPGSMPLPPPSTVPSTMYLGGQHPPPMPSGPPSHAPERQPQLSYSGTNDKYEFILSVEQQPQRARMCGFGDKDRRPITPPPCIRLIIKDRNTGKEVDFSEVDGSFFILQVDLWADDASREVNLIRASSSSPAVSISTASVTSFPPAPEHRAMMEPGSAVVYVNTEGHPVYTMPPGYSRPMMPGQYGPAGFYPQPGYAAAYGMPNPVQNSSGLYTRNLIGSLTVNASRLNDPEGKTGYWFVLQDLSVRTEGFFRLKMNFIDVGSQMNGGGDGLNKGKAPVLAWVFSDKFQVYSAKKFPGVIESTPLSKCFAGQGIKIPIRKDAKAENQDDDDY